MSRISQIGGGKIRLANFNSLQLERGLVENSAGTALSTASVTFLQKLGSFLSLLRTLGANPAYSSWHLRQMMVRSALPP
jgi:hypothetical protein